MTKHRLFLSLGSNLGQREANLAQATALIGQRIGRVVKQSSLIETEPWGFSSENSFLNSCLEVETELSPFSVLDETQAIERLMGRSKKSANGVYEDRTIDIDILLYDHLTLRSDRLNIPHPLMWERDFVMKPLRELLPDLPQKN